MSDQPWTPRIRRIDNDGQERLQYVRSLIQEKRVDEARDELLSILEQNDKLGRAHLMLGSVYQGQGLLAEALQHFKYAIEIDPMDAQAHLRAGICSLRMNQFEDARALLKSALDLDPKMVGGRVALAQALSRVGDVDAAIEQAEHALRLDPQLASARQLLAKLLSKSGRSKEAIQELDGFVAANPDNARAAVSLARLQGQQGEAKKAIELLETAAKATPESDNVWSTLGRMKMTAKDYEGAEKAFTELMRVRPDSRFAPLQLVSALIPQGKFDQARDILKPLPRRGRMASLVHQYYGDMHVAQKRYDEAVQSVPCGDPAERRRREDAGGHRGRHGSDQGQPRNRDAAADGAGEEARRGPLRDGPAPCRRRWRPRPDAARRRWPQAARRRPVPRTVTACILRRVAS